MIKKLAIEKLKPGMEVVRLAADIWEHLPNLYTEPGTIQSESEILKIRKQGFQHVFIAIPDPEGRSDEKRLDLLVAEREHTPPSKPRVPFEKEIETAKRVYDNSMNHARRIVNDAKMGRQVDYEASLDVVGDIVDSAIRNRDTLICLSKISNYDSYTYAHSINVAAIAVVYGEFLGLTKEELVHLGVAGMMHDLGKTAVPERIINKRGRLNEAEFAEIRKHPSYSGKILSRAKGVHDSVTQAVVQHHEKINGSGYPNNLKKDEISGFARILSLADVYDALTSDRSYKEGILPNKALAIMYGMREHDFDPLEVQLFIKCLGIFPSGSLVKLNSGVYGVVYESNPTSPLMPKIKIILDEDLRPIPSQLVDLAAQEAMGGQNLEVLECADPSSYRLNLQPFLTRRNI